MIALPPADDQAPVTIERVTGLQVTNFRAAVQGRGAVILTWETADEAQLLGFNLLRQADGGCIETITPELLLAERSGTNQGGTYTYTDKIAPASQRRYWLEAIQLNGIRIRSNSVGVGD